MDNKTLYFNLLTSFVLIRTLQTPPAQTVKQLARTLDIRERKVYRMIEVLKEIGYPIVKNKQTHRYSINLNIAHTQSLLEHQLKELHDLQSVILIRSAITHSQHLKLINYDSPSDGILPERIVEPLSLSLDSKRLQVYDLTEEKQRQYKIARIESLDILNTNFINNHLSQAIDIFGTSGSEWLSVQMHLSKRAYLLLIEEFPTSRRFVTPVGEGYLFDGKVLSWLGIGRFVLGVIGEVKVLEPVAFKDYLRKVVARFDIC